MWHQDINWACQRTVFHLCPTLPELPTFSESQPAPTCSVGSRGAPCTNHLRSPTTAFGRQHILHSPKNTPSFDNFLSRCLSSAIAQRCLPGAPLFLAGHRLSRGTNLHCQPVFGEPRLSRCLGVMARRRRHLSGQPIQTTTHFPTADWNVKWNGQHHQDPWPRRTTTSRSNPPPVCADMLLPCKRRPHSGPGNRGLRRTIRCPGCPGSQRTTTKQRNLVHEHAKMHSLSSCGLTFC